VSRSLKNQLMWLDTFDLNGCLLPSLHLPEHQHVCSFVLLQMVQAKLTGSTAPVMFQTLWHRHHIVCSVWRLLSPLALPCWCHCWGVCLFARYNATPIFGATWAVCNSVSVFVYCLSVHCVSTCGAVSSCGDLWSNGGLSEY
jgi:hypothetical protein